ncbi:hypothetical protein C8Q76DRAFT_134958 [Earliella scabrosa]|nr:hypothetical protein C8Q76DRAFT_134958 [Earliella scabrosa]
MCRPAGGLDHSASSVSLPEYVEERHSTPSTSSVARHIPDTISSSSPLPRMPAVSGFSGTATPPPAPASYAHSTVARSVGRAPSSQSPKTLSWHCRACLREPCEDPISTMCGHIFCHRCLVDGLRTELCCPFCKQTFLVRLQVDAGL